MPSIRFEFEDDDGVEQVYGLPAKYEVCPRCRGEGTHCNPNIDGNGITAGEWAEEWDEDSREAYIRGDYDVTCQTCDGQRVVLELDHEACQATSELQQLRERYIEHRQQKAQWDYEDRMMRRMESGGRDY